MYFNNNNCFIHTNLQLEICVCAAMNSEFAYVDDAVVIDLSDINSVTVDVQSKVCFTDIRESF